MAKITYDDKVALNVNQNIADENKVNAADMNEIKTVVNSNDFEDVTTDGAATKCGYKIDGHDVYVKRVNFGALPNNTSKTVASGIDFASHTLVKLEGIAKYSANNVAFPIPYAHASTIGNNIAVNIDNSNYIVVTTGTNRSSYNGIINIYFY